MACGSPWRTYLSGLQISFPIPQVPHLNTIIIISSKFPRRVQDSCESDCFTPCVFPMPNIAILTYCTHWCVLMPSTWKFIFSFMLAYDLTLKAIICLDVLSLFHQLVDRRVFRINFCLNSYDKDKLNNKNKNLLDLLTLYWSRLIRKSYLPVFPYSLEGNNLNVLMSVHVVYFNLDYFDFTDESI
jgi:hypothetical protein